MYTVVEIDSGDTCLPYYLRSPSGSEHWFSEKSLDDNFIRLTKVTGEPVPAKTPSIQTTLMELLLDELELHTHKDFEISYVKDGKKVSVSVEDVDPKEIVDDLLMDGESFGTALLNEGKAVVGIKIQNPFR